VKKYFPKLYRPGVQSPLRKKKMHASSHQNQEI